MNGKRHRTRAEMKWDRVDAEAGDSTDLQGTIIIAAVRDDCVHDGLQYPAACGQLSPRTRLQAVRRQHVGYISTIFSSTDAAMELHSNPIVQHAIRHITIIVSVNLFHSALRFFYSRSQIFLLLQRTKSCLAMLNSKQS